METNVHHASEEAVSEKVLISVSPSTGEVLGYTEEDSVEDLKSAVVAAKQAQKEWGKKSFSERAEYLFRIRDFIAENTDEIADIISKDTGKTRIDALSTEVLPVTMAITYYARHAGKILKRTKLKPGNILTINKRSYIDRVPYGVVGIISPWNYPFSIPFHEIAMALISGNAVVLKVASSTLEVGKIIKKAVDAAGLPQSIFTLKNIPGSLAGDAFINSGIDKLFFTGSVAVGKKLMAKASERLLPLSLELGGNDAMIVCNDADPVRAAGGALWAGLSNSGQSCAGVERIYVEKGIYDEFMRLLKDKLNTLRQGPDTGFNVEIGSLTTKEQLKTVKEHLKDAVEKGASVFIGPGVSGENTGMFHPPVILENVNNSMLTMQEETFGPILAVKKVNDIQEAINEANDSNLGLSASVWTKDKAKAHQIASCLEAGAVMINDHLMSHGLAETPWGGFKQSGLERTHGHLGLEGMTQPRVVIDDILPGVKKNMWWYPHSEKVYAGLKGGIEFLYLKDFPKRVDGMIRLMKVFMRTFRN